jgi:hypothetical protein
MAGSYELFMWVSGCLFCHRFRRFPMHHHSEHAMETYRSIYEYAVFVPATRDLSDEVRALDFDKLNELLSTLPHLQPVNMEKKTIEHPFKFGNSWMRWKYYDPKSKDSSTLTNLSETSSKPVESTALCLPTEVQEQGPTLSHNETT